MFVPKTLPQVLSEIQSGRKRLSAVGCVQDQDAKTDGTSLGTAGLKAPNSASYPKVTTLPGSEVLHCIQLNAKVR